MFLFKLHKYLKMRNIDLIKSLYIKVISNDSQTLTRF